MNTALSAPVGDRINVGWGPRTAGAGRDHQDADKLRPAAIAAVEGKQPSKAERAEYSKLLFGTPLSPGLESLRRAMAHATSGHHEQAAKAAAEAAELLADPFGGLVIVFKRRKAFHDTWAKSSHYAALQKAFADRDATLAAFKAVENDENTTPQKKQRLNDEYQVAAKALNGLVNSDDEAYTALRRDLKATGDPGLPAHDWRSCKI